MIMIVISIITMFMQELCFQGAATALFSSHSPNNIHAWLVGDSGMWVYE